MQECDGKLHEAAACSTQLASLQQESADLLQASNIELVMKAESHKLSVRQLQSDQSMSPLKFNEDGLQKLNESILALRKTALVVPLLQVNLLDSNILSGGAEADLQRMLGDSMKLVSCSAYVLPQLPRQRVAIDRPATSLTSHSAVAAMCCRSQADLDMLYQGSRDGWTYEDWAAKCVGQSNTLTLIKVSRRCLGMLTRRVCATAPHLRDDADWS